jgi:hypothetical protein
LSDQRESMGIVGIGLGEAAMATDPHLGPQTKASPLGASTETGGPLRELVEALMAIGNYLAAADRILDGAITPVEERLSDVLDKSMAQYGRAANAARRLNKLLRAMESGDDDTPPGVRR